MKPLYLAPMNFYSNAFFRHFALLKGADFVFSELIMIDRIDDEVAKNKLKVYDGDLSKTIFQIGARNKDVIIEGVNLIKKIHPSIVEINLNAGCPQSTMQKNFVCSGLLFDEKMLFDVSKSLVEECKKISCIPSVKIRLGTSPDNIRIKNYLKLLLDAGIKKVYIHARTLKYNYSKPAIYDSLKDLKKEFSEIELIFNGDVDSYARYKRLSDCGADAIMIGRAALSNPDLFSQIKNKEKVRRDFYDPFLNDPHMNIIDGLPVIDSYKKELIKEFILLAEKNSEDLSLVKKHLQLLTKGSSQRKIIDSLLRNSLDYSSLKKLTDLF